MYSILPIRRSLLLALSLGWFFQVSTPSLSWGGAFTFAGESNGTEVVTHPTGYTGTGGTLTVSVCIDSSSPDAADMEIPVRNVVANWNARIPTTGNLVAGAASELSPGEFDFESVALHEVGHCIGLAHTNAASESGLSGNDRNYTKATDGADNTFDLDAGTDGVIGSADDVRGDDVNLHWFRTATNDPFTIDSVVDSTTYSQDLADLPVGDFFPANADRSVATLLGVPNSEAVMQQGTFSYESQRTLVHDDIATLRYAMSGLNEVAGDSDDYDLVLDYIGQATSCDIKLAFDDAETGFAVCSTSGVFVNAEHIRISSANVYFNTGFNWYFNSSLLGCGDGVLDAGEACDDGNQIDGDCCSSTCTFEAVGSVCDDGSACTETDVCDGVGSCTGSLVVCDNGLFCDGEETCDPASGCESGTPVGVDDGISCTDDSCDETLDVVLNVANDTNCDNGLFCDGSEVCDAALDCQAGTSVAVDDGISCTDDSCDETLDVVLNVANDTNCDNGLFCDGSEVCDAALDCQAGTSVAVDDGISCTDDSCDETLDVVLNVANDTNCDNGLFCDGSEVCDAALDCQAGTSVAVDDGISCTDDSCDETLDVVLNVANDTNCDNGLFCDGSEVCDAALDCQAGTSVAVDDGISCTDDSCDETLDVVLNVANDTNCDDFNDCTADSCDAVLGCAHETIEGCEIPVDATGPTSRFMLYALMVLLGTIGAGAVVTGPGDERG